MGGMDKRTGGHCILFYISFGLEMFSIYGQCSQEVVERDLEQSW